MTLAIRLVALLLLWVASTAQSRIASPGGTLNAVTSVTGTANEITSSGGATPTLSLPGALTFTGKTVTGGTFSGPTLSGTVAGTPTWASAQTMPSLTTTATTALTLPSGGGTFIFKNSATWGALYLADSGGVGSTLGILDGFYAVADEAGTTSTAFRNGSVSADGINLGVSRSGGGALNFTTTAVSVDNGNLTFASDNTQDIGASGATRPRAGYFGTSVRAPVHHVGTNLSFSNATPTITASFGGAGKAIAGNATAFRVTVGAGGDTTGVVAFNTTFANAPVCVANNETTGNLARTVTTTTAVTVNAVMVAGDLVTVQCQGY